jgi:transposase-like protein
MGVEVEHRRTTVMGHDRTKKAVRKPRSLSKRPASTTRSTLRETFLNARVALRELMVWFGVEAFAEMLEEDRTELCGAKHHPRSDRKAYRYGYDEGRVVLGGRQVAVRKPRVRSLRGRELELPCWKVANEKDPLEERVLEQMLVGVSSRQYARSLEPLPEELPTVGVSRSSFSRALVARTGRQVDAFLNRPLEGIDLPVLMIDGTNFGDHVLVTALGIDSTGRKHVLGVVEGSTESEEVGRSLLRNLLDRGLAVERARLFVIDGGKGIRKAIRTTFGAWALVARCRLHKLRNVAEHLPKSKRAWVKAAMRRAWGEQSVGKARGKLEALAAQLEEEHPGAAGSIREGLEETLTLIALGVGGSLLKTLYSTNPIESLLGRLKQVARNVKRWRGGKMAVRWAAAGLREAEKSFRRVKGFRELPGFIAALEAQVPASSSKSNEKAA